MFLSFFIVKFLVVFSIFFGKLLVLKSFYVVKLLGFFSFNVVKILVFILMVKFLEFCIIFLVFLVFSLKCNNIVKKVFINEEDFIFEKFLNKLEI